MTSLTRARLLRTLLLTAASLLALMAQAQDKPDSRNLAVKSQSASAMAEKRVALVIGNSAYGKSPLKNPVNDAADVAQKLRSLGFDVIERTNLKSNQIGRTLREFRARLTPGAVALFFYAGHGLQIKGENYLPAVDADIEGEEDVPNQSIAVRQVMDVMEDAKTRMNLAFLDACRNNPYSRSFRSAGEGLARVSAPSGTLISFATRPGSVAADGTGRNGLYTTHLLSAIETPNLPVELMLKRVTTGVKGASRGLQEPWMEGSIEGDFYFRPLSGQASANTGSQQEAVDRAVQEAVQRANEQAARERTDMQASLQKMIEQALARQSAMGGDAVTTASAAPLSAAPAQTMAMARPVAAANGKGPQVGDEWVYLARDKIWGKQKKVVWRVRGVASGAGVLEQVLVDGTTVHEWASNGVPELIGTPTDSGLFFGPHWDGRGFSILPAKGVGGCVGAFNCRWVFKSMRNEKVTLAIGTFDALRIDGDLLLRTPLNASFNAGQITVWYSEADKRLLRQSASARHQLLTFDEDIELTAAPTSALVLNK